MIVVGLMYTNLIYQIESLESSNDFISKKRLRATYLFKQLWMLFMIC